MIVWQFPLRHPTHLDVMAADWPLAPVVMPVSRRDGNEDGDGNEDVTRSEEHTSELQSPC